MRTWARSQAVLVTGPTGAGKTYLACALAHAAIRHGHTALYLRAPRMLDDLAIARADGRLSRLLAAWARIGVLILDDLLLRPLTSEQAADLLEVIEDRARLRATIITSQLPVALWHQAIADPTIADAILDRTLEKANRIELSGQSSAAAAAATSSRTGQPRRPGPRAGQAMTRPQAPAEPRSGRTGTSARRPGSSPRHSRHRSLAAALAGHRAQRASEDRRILDWMSNWDVTVLTVASWITPDPGHQARTTATMTSVRSATRPAPRTDTTRRRQTT